MIFVGPISVRIPPRSVSHRDQITMAATCHIWFTSSSIYSLPPSRWFISKRSRVAGSPPTRRMAIYYPPPSPVIPHVCTVHPPGKTDISALPTVTHGRCGQRRNCRRACPGHLIAMSPSSTASTSMSSPTLAASYSAMAHTLKRQQQQQQYPLRLSSECQRVRYTRWQ